VASELLLVLGAACVAEGIALAGGLRAHSPEMRAMIETLIAATLAGSVLTLAELYRLRHGQRELFLFAGMATLGLTDTVSYVGPADVGLKASSWPTTALPVAALLAGVCFVFAARSPRGQTVGNTHPWGRAAVVAALIGTGFAEAVGRLLTNQARDPGNPALHGDRLAVIAVTALSTLLLAFAGCRMVSHSRGEESAMSRWCGIGILLLAAGLADRIVLGPAAGGEVTDVVLLRLVSYTIVAFGLAREVQVRQRLAAVTIARAERQRLASALHDGLCQDLAFIAAHGERVAAVLGDDNPLAIAARRALATSRGALAELAPPADQGIGEALRVLAAELSTRFQITVKVEADVTCEPSPADRNDLARIAHEAIINSIKHGGAQHVNVLVSDASGHLAMTVDDDGHSGPADEWREGFGMASMRERAASMGAELSEHTRDEGGTELKVTIA
jgi:signal transduction histidine kinase